MSKLIKLLARPVLLAKVLAMLLFVRRQLSLGQFLSLIKSDRSAKKNGLSELDELQYADWVLRKVCSTWIHSSPCLCHSLVLYRLATQGTVLRISAQRTGELTTHASVVFRGQEFSIAESWQGQPIFTEFVKGES